MHRKERKLPATTAGGCHPEPPLRLVDFLRRAPVSVPQETAIARALEVMAEECIGSLIVISPEHGRPVGIFTLRDLLCRVAIPATDMARPVAEVMTPDPVAVPQSLTVGQAAREMGKRELRHMLVTDSAGKLTGIVSRTDIYQWLCDSCASIRRAKTGVSVLRQVAS